MSWFDDVSAYILNHLEDYATEILLASNIEKAGKTIFVNPSPCCDHQKCFTLTRGTNAGFCHSCKEGGTLIQIAQNKYGEIEGLEKLSEWSGIKFNFAAYQPEQAAAKQKFARFQRICEKAVEYYHQRLFKTGEVIFGEEKSKPSYYQVKIRKHDKHGVLGYKIGYSGGWQELKESLLNDGFEEEEIKQASSLIFIPDGYFVYPYFNERGHLIRINARSFIRYCKGKEKKGSGFSYDCDMKFLASDKVMPKSHENMSGHTMNFERMSRGEKEGAFFFRPDDLKKKLKKKKKYAILVEGENDVISVDESLQLLPPEYKNHFVVFGIGGSSPKGMFENPLLREFDEIYEAFDNDEAGDKYREQLDAEAPDIPVRHLNIPKEEKDIDQYLKLGENETLAERFQALIDTAEYVVTRNFKLFRDAGPYGNLHNWEIKNRHCGLRYEVDSYQLNKRKYQGTLQIFKNGQQVDSKRGDLDTIKVVGELLYLRTALSNRIKEYYNDVSWSKNEPVHSYEHLVDMYYYTSRRNDVVKALAWYIHHSNGREFEDKVQMIQKRLGPSEADVILKEVNGFDNQEIDIFAIRHRIQLAQSLFPRDGNGYMYFVKNAIDDGQLMEYPCLLSNKKNEIRLDFLKRKTAQCKLLIENKYELPREVDTNFVDVADLSLQYVWVDKWLKDEIPDEDLKPAKIIKEIEGFIRLMYYTTDDVVKVLALWIYATYFYTMFKSGFPYLQLTGGKGSGKSTLDDILYLLCFNPSFAISITGPSLFRQVGMFGGTFILDEQEALADEKKVNESDMAGVLKGGYSTKGDVFRFDKENGWNEKFSPFGPKVISNINGLDSVIADRCIAITTFRAKEEKVKDLIETSVFREERREEIYNLTSRSALSALTHFEELDRVAKETNSRLQTGNLRLTQILKPLIIMARFVGGDYEEHLMRFYQNNIQSNKEETERSTLEGKIKFILKSISEEILGINKDKNYFLAPGHMYDVLPHFDKVTGMFSLNSMHFKTFAEELSEDETYSIKQIHAAIKPCLPDSYDIKKRRSETKVKIEDENLIRQLDNKIYQRVFVYTFNVREFVSKQEQAIKYGEDASEQELF